VLREIDRLELAQVRVGLMPLGTGNDLARVLGWMGGDVSEESIAETLKAVECSKEVLLDRSV
jgi:diacylglycerol kinase (ATP)